MMKKKGSDKPFKLIRSERGQSMTEYVILVILVAIVSLPILRLYPDAVRGYLRPFYYCISRPIP